MRSIRSPFGTKANTALAWAGLSLLVFLGGWAKLAVSGTTNAWLPAAIWSTVIFVLGAVALIWSYRKGRWRE